MSAAEGVLIIAFSDADQWESWLAKHCEQIDSVWLKIAKVSSGNRSVTMAEALDVALCYGWISGQRKACDDGAFLLKFTPRRPGSAWSKATVTRVDTLMTSGRMRGRGLVEVAAAKADGRWSAAA